MGSGRGKRNSGRKLALSDVLSWACDAGRCWPLARGRVGDSFRSRTTATAQQLRPLDELETFLQGFHPCALW